MNSTSNWIIGLVIATVVGFLIGFYFHSMMTDEPHSSESRVEGQKIENGISIESPSSEAADAAKTAEQPLPDSGLAEGLLDGDSVIVSPKSAIPDTAAGTYFPIYGLDPETLSEKVNFYVRIPEQLPLIEKVAFMAERISRFIYRITPIEVFPLTEQNGKKIARINLMGASWGTTYFQGSTGGWMTTVTLKKSFLQPDYTGEWIDGVQFFYEGKPISNEWDHINLHGVIYRNGN